MSMKLLKEAIRLADADDGLKDVKVKHKRTKFLSAERERQQLAAIATTSEYDPESDDIVVTSNVQRRKEFNESNRRSVKNVSLLERSRARRKKDFLKRNIKYMVYETERKLDPGKASKLVDFMNERDRRRKNVLRRIRRRNNGVRDGKRKSKKSNGSSVFTDEDFMRVGPDRIKLLQERIPRK